MSKKAAIALAGVLLVIITLLGFQFSSSDEESATAKPSVEARLETATEVVKKQIAKPAIIRKSIPPIDGYLKAGGRLQVAASGPQCIGLSYDNSYEEPENFIKEINCYATDALKGDIDGFLDRMTLLLKWKESWNFYVDFQADPSWNLQVNHKRKSILIKGLTLKLDHPGQIDPSSYQFDIKRRATLRELHRKGTEQLFIRQGVESSRASQIFMDNPAKMKPIWEQAKQSLADGVRLMLQQAKHAHQNYKIEVHFINEPS